jgi:hypothetical protein
VRLLVDIANDAIDPFALLRALLYTGFVGMMLAPLFSDWQPPRDGWGKR